MKNLNQIRAKNAIDVKIDSNAEDSKSMAKKVPAMIMENGIIATAAFALDNNKSGYKSIFEKGIIPHLEELHLLETKMNLLDFIEHMQIIDASELRHITTETMEYLSYLRRFASLNQE